MANNPNILVFGLPYKEESLLKESLLADELLRPLVGIHRSLGALLTGPGAVGKGFRDGVWLVVLDRTYDIAARTHDPRGAGPASFSKQLACVNTWFPDAQVFCSTNSPVRFHQEQFETTFADPRFLGSASYASLHRNLHFGDALKK